MDNRYKQIIPAPNRVGTQTLVFNNRPSVASMAAIAGDLEGEGTFGDHYDMVLTDDLWGEETWEKAESKMFEEVVRKALAKDNLDEKWVECLIGGDLLNQIIAANFAARQLGLPFLGVYGACSTMAESLLVGSVLISGGFMSCVACAASSHFSTAERQYRSPLEMGTQRTPTAQRTVTGAGCTILVGPGSGSSKGIEITHGTVGKVVDLGITDANNMGAAMAPAATDSICAHLADTGRTVDDYDLIVTGDLGALGSELTRELCLKKGVDLKDKYLDCGDSIFTKEQDMKAGGSGCGCSAVVLNSYLLKEMMSSKYNRILFLATGALLSVDSTQQGESIPCVAHGVVFERRMG
mgnify:CR=1 FL=1